MSDQQFQFLGVLFQTLTNDSRYPETKDKFVVEIWHDFPPDLANELGESGFYARVLGIFGSQGEGITAARREIEFMRHGHSKS